MSRIKNSLHNSLWVLIFSLFLFFSLAFNIRSSWFILYFLGLLLLVSRLTLGTRLKKILISIEGELTLTQGETGKLQFFIAKTKKGPLFLPNLEGTLYMNQSELLLSKRETKKLISEKITLEAVIPPDQERGVYHGMQVKLAVSDSFGLFSKGHVYSLPEELYVLPEKRLAVAEKLDQQLKQQKFWKAHDFLKDYDVEALRFYREGDQLNQVDWKLSAKRNELIVKELAFQKEEKVLMIFFGNDGRHFERLLATYCSYTSFFLKATDLIEVVIFDEEQGLVQPTKTIYAGLEPFANQEQALMECFNQIGTKKQLILFVPNLSQEVKRRCQQLKRGSQVLLVTLDQKGRLVYATTGKH